MTSPWTAAPPGGTYASSGSVTLVDGNTFMVCGHSGDLVGEGVDGLFMLDTRVLNRWSLEIDGQHVESIAAVVRGPFSVTFVGRGLGDAHRESDLAVVRGRHVGHGLREDLELRHHGLVARTMTVTLTVGSDFASLFEVKAGHIARTKQGILTVDGGRVFIEAPQPGSVDGLVIQFDREPDRVYGDSVEWDVTLAPSSQFCLCAEIGVVVDGRFHRPSHRCGEAIEDAIPVSRLARWRSAAPRFTCDDVDLMRAVERAVEDLGALRIFDPDHAERVVVAAGAPWFMTLFGRDALITAWMALIVDHQLARGVLASLADAQGQRRNADTEEEPGRILHEVRYDSHSARLLGGHNIYFGTIDATPLFVMLVAELARWSGDPESVARYMPAVDRAMQWIETIADRDGDGFLEYQRSRATGLANQGWKDSWDGIRYLDGRVAEAPIALCEAQGYAYAAMVGRADLADLFGDTERSRDYRTRAHRLHERFEAEFWITERGWYAVGLDGDKAPIDSLTSNLGHCLWAGVVSPRRADRVAELLTSPEMFSGWGIRTLSNAAGGFNPLSYHCGSVWPHDTAISIAGLARYCQDRAVNVVYRGLVDTAAAGGGRLPELFAGFDRADLAAPVPYPASCSPQAWAAASPLLVVRSILGLDPDLVHGVVRLRPRLPDGVSELTIDGVPLADGRVRISVSRSSVLIDGLPETIRVQRS